MGMLTVGGLGMGLGEGGRWRPAAVFSHSFPRSSCLLSVVLVTGTIRKAQNLLKQYSQHGLDGKKGGSNLIPLEGNHPVFFSCSLLRHHVCTLVAGQSLQAPRRATGESLGGGRGGDSRCLVPLTPAGAGQVPWPRPGPVWLTAALPSLRLPTPSLSLSLSPI